jgi:hypothetical protein
MSKTIRTLIAVAALTALAMPVWAQGPGMGAGPRGGGGPGTGPVAANCQTEIEKFCSGLEHGGRAIRDCLEKNKDKAGDACKNALATTGPGRRM